MNEAPETKRIDRVTVRRAGAVMLVFAVLALALVFVLWDMQIMDFEKYQAKVLDQMTVSTVINPLRGQITDRSGNILAANGTNYLIFISPQDIIDAMEADKKADEPPTYKWTDENGKTYENRDMDEVIAKALSEILDVEYDFVMEKSALEGRRYEVIKKEVSEEDAEQVRQFIADNDLTMQIYLRASTFRTYPYGDLASQVIGFTNRDGVGVYGLESYYNNLLEGTSGKYITAQDAHSDDMPFEYESLIDPKNGYTVESTIDVYIQYELQNQLKATYDDNGAGERVTGIVMNVNTGEVYAMATYPSFDLNEPYEMTHYYYKAPLEGLDPESEEYNTAYMNSLFKMWQNKAVTDLYEPGSTFKPITASMGFDEGVVTETTPFYCGGSYAVDGYPRPIACHEAAGHGAVTFTEGLQQSCNPTLMQLAQRIGAENFYNYFLAFGYAGRTNIDLPAESYPIISSRKDFSGVSLAVYSFGQTFKVTPIQQIRSICTIANGGYLIVPHLLKSIKDSDGNVVAEYSTEPLRQVVSTSTTDRVTKILEEGVSGNGGAKNAYVKGYKVAAKTGTSEKLDKYDENGDRPYRVGSTVAFAPAYNPEIAALIVVDEPTNGVVFGSRVAAPYISNLLATLLPYLGYEAEYTEAERLKTEVAVPNLIGVDVESAKSDLSWRELGCEVVGDGPTVTGQVPEGGSNVTLENGRVIIYTSDIAPSSNCIVPELIGKTAEAANRLLINAGLNVHFTGASGNAEGAMVISQSVPAGTEVPEGTPVSIDIQYTDTRD